MYEIFDCQNTEKSISQNVISHCKTSFDPISKRGLAKISFDLDDLTSYEYECIFPKVPTNNYLEYLAITASVKVMLKENLEGKIYTSSELALNQIRGNYKVRKTDFIPFLHFIKDNIGTSIELEFKRSKEMMFSKYSKKQMDGSIMREIDEMMADSYCYSLKINRPLNRASDNKRENVVRRRFDRLNRKKHEARNEYDKSFSSHSYDSDLDYGIPEI